MGGKGLDVTMENHEITLMNARNQRNKEKKKKIDYALYDDMPRNEDKPQKKLSFDEKMKAHLAKREALINAANKRKEHYKEQIKLGNIDSLIHEIEMQQNEQHSKTRNQPIFSHRKRKETKSKSSVHQNIIKEMGRNKKRKL